MISKREILDIAAKLNLNPHVVEKDYALGWALAGIFAHADLSESWVFKGGTCLKKCHFETYRFSEDLDFTLQDPSHLDESFLRPVFADIAAWIYDRSGLEFAAGRQKFDIYRNPRGNLNCEGKLSYRGPVSPTSGGWPRIKLDLTADERLVLPPIRTPIFHPYGDCPDDGIEVLAYDYVEAFGEKVRALAERTRPRDLYDVINLYRNIDARPSPAVLLDVLGQKCEFKGIPVPTFASLQDDKSDLAGMWASMLQHQLPALPPVESFWEALPEFFDWLEGGAAAAVPAVYRLADGETVIRERTFRLPLPGAAQAHIEIIRFAATNRLCVDLDYQRSTRRIEPYSLRRTRDGNIILHAWNLDKNEHRSYRIDRIDGARTTNQAFSPRYAVELTPAGPVSVPPTRRSSISGSASALGLGRPTVTQPRARSATRRNPRNSQGLTYVYKCALCGKTFSRKKQSATLNPHKMPNGHPCPGRIGIFLEVKY